MIPIFIGGCDRSGTTLMGSLLGMQSQVLAIPEAQFVIQVLQEGQRKGYIEDRHQVFEKIRHHWRFKLWQLPVEASGVPALVWTGSYADLIRWFVQAYGRQVSKPTPVYWADHTPLNTRYAVTLFEHFPEAKLIHMVRDGRAVIASILPLDWGPNTVIKATNWWVEKVAYGLAAETLFGPDKVIRIRYEDVVSHTEATLRQLCAFIGIPFEPAMAMGGGLQLPEYTTRQHALANKPPDPGRLDAWRTDLSQRQREIIESLSGDILPLLGYELDYGSQSAPVTALELLWQEICEPLQRETINRFKRSRRIKGHIRP